MQSKDKIREFILNELVVDKKHSSITDDSPLMETGVIDSLGVIRIVGFLEDELSVQIRDDDLVPENFSTIGAISELAERRSA